MSNEIHEREAFERWCPMTHTRGTSTMPVTAMTKCLGSECMAWVMSEVNDEFGRCGLVTTSESCGKV